jgi:hypothetical protein
VVLYNYMQDFATQDGLYTIEPIDVTQITAMGQASGLSFYDHMVINAAYCNGEVRPNFLYLTYQVIHTQLTECPSC